jgi:hypothetical protein
MSANDKYKHYSAADIQRYLQGDLSARDMQALEAAALEDPFLADALEGMEKDRRLRGETAFGEDLAGLKERLGLRIAKKKKGLVLPLYHSGWRAVAAVIILVSLGAITYRYVLHGRSSAPSLASAEAGKTTPPADRISSSGASGSSGVSGSSGAENDSSKVSIPPSNLARSRPSAKPDLSRQANEPEQKVAKEKKEASESIADKNAKADMIIQPDSIKDEDALKTRDFKTRDRRYQFERMSAGSAKPASPDAGSNAYFADSTNRRTASQYIIGKVTDGNNNPIPLITISFKGHKQDIRTDNNGLFRVQMLGSDSSIHVRISSTGYAPVELPAYALTEGHANSGVANTIRLLPQPDALSSVTVMGYGTMKKTDQDKALPAPPQTNAAGTGTDPKSAAQQSSPLSGWPAYNNYLEKNKRDPSIDSTKKGIEAISFNINKKGKLSSFKIEQSLSPAHDSLLLRLIRHGSAWKSLKGNNGSAIVVLSY